MAKGKSTGKGSSKTSGVEPFEDDINDEVINDEGEEVMAAKNKEKGSSRRRRIEAEAEAEDDEVEVEDGADDEDADDEDEVDEDDTDDDDEEDEEEAPPVDLGFAPFIIHEDAEWEIEDVIDDAEPGKDIYFFRPPPDDETPAKWYKLQHIEVGEK